MIAGACWEVEVKNNIMIKCLYIYNIEFKGNNDIPIDEIGVRRKIILIL
jgi:hypothetical protein